MKSLTWAACLALAGTAFAHAHHEHEEVPEHVREELLRKWDQEVGIPVPNHLFRTHTHTPFQFTFSGIASFAHLKPVKCLIEPDERYDIAVIGAPFDTAVSYRPGKTPNTLTVCPPQTH